MSDDLQPPYGEIWDLLKDGKVIPFLGVGASLGVPGVPWDEDHPSRLPTGAELSRYLAHKVSFPAGEPTDDLSKVAQYFRIVVGRQRLRQRLREIFVQNYPQSIEPVASIHDLLAAVPANLLIVTTNYDDLIEKAFRARQRPYHLVVHATDNPEWAASVIYSPPNGQEPAFVSSKKLRIDLDQATVIYKMHGSLDRVDPERDSYVISEDDYVDFIVRMAKQTAVPAIFAEPFRARHFLFLGYSLRDWNFRVILSKIEKDMLRTKQEELPFWAIQYNPSALEEELWNKRAVKIYNMPIHEFVKRLAPVL